MSLSLLAGKRPARKELYFIQRGFLGLDTSSPVIYHGTGSSKEQTQTAQTWDSALHLHLSHESDDLLQVGRSLGCIPQGSGQKDGFRSPGPSCVLGQSSELF